MFRLFKFTILFLTLLTAQPCFNQTIRVEKKLYNEENAGLPFRQIMEIFEDWEGWFWLCKSCQTKPNCEKDLVFFHPLTKEIQTLDRRFGSQLTIKSNQIESLVRDSSNFYFTADEKLIQWSKDKGIRESPIKGLSTTPKLWAKANEGILGAYCIEDPEVPRHMFNQYDFQYVAIDLHGNLRQGPKPIRIWGFEYNNLWKIINLTNSYL